MPQKRQAKRRARRRPFEPEDNPRERLGVHAGARLRNSPKRSLAKLRVTAIREARREVLSPAPSPVVPGASNWVQLGPTAIPLGQTYSGARVLVSGRITEILVHPSSPSIMYTATARGGVWKSTDGGVNWAPKSDNEASLAIGALALARSAPDTLYAGTGEGNIYYYRTLYPENSLNEAYEGSGVLKSLDGGNTWTLQGTAQFTGAAFFGIAVHPTDPNTAFAATTRGLFRTTNGGTNWSQLTNGLPAISSSVFAATDVAIDPATPSTVYVAFWGRGVYRTTNGLAANPSFSKITGIPAGSSRIAIAVSPTNPARVYAAVADASDNFSGLYRTVAGGGGAPTWQAIPFSGASVFAYGAYTLNVAVDVSTPDIVYVSGVSLFRIVRNAATGAWSASDIGGPIHPDNHALATHPTDNLRIYAGNDGGVYQSDDGGGTWQDDDQHRPVHRAVRVHRSAPSLGCGGDRRHAGQRHGAVQEQRRLQSRGRRRRRGGDDRSVESKERDPHVLRRQPRSARRRAAPSAPGRTSPAGLSAEVSSTRRWPPTRPIPTTSPSGPIASVSTVRRERAVGRLE